MSVKYIPVQWNPNKYLYDAVLLICVAVYILVFIRVGTPEAGVTRPIDGAIVRMRAFGTCASHIVVPCAQAVDLPEALSFTEGAAISCGTGTAFGAIRRIGMEGGATLMVMGQGPVGLSATMLGAAMGVSTAKYWQRP